MPGLLFGSQSYIISHANNDPHGVLNEDDVKTDHLLIEACVLYVAIGCDITVEMRAFLLWRLAVYPNEDGDILNTAAGPFHELEREHQVEVGMFILERYKSETRT